MDRVDERQLARALDWVLPLGVCCAEAQADGVPCSDLHADCLHCENADPLRQLLLRMALALPLTDRLH